MKMRNVALVSIICSKWKEKNYLDAKLMHGNVLCVSL